MKKLAVLILSFLLFIFVSCASKPASKPMDLPSDIDNAPEVLAPAETEEETAPESDENIDEEQVASEEDTVSDEDADFEDLSEPVVEEELPELPVIELEDSVEIIQMDEPEIKEVPVENEDESVADETQNENLEETVASEEEADKQEADENSSQTVEEAVEEASDETVEAEEEIDVPVKKEPPKPSRSMTVYKNQMIDVVYPGKGWVFQGVIDEDGNVDVRNKYFVFGGRKLGGENQTFMLRARNPGKYILHFYKNDNLNGSYIDDYLEVLVNDKTVDSTEHILAPDYATFVPPQAKITAETVKAKKLAEKTLQEEKKQELQKKPLENQKISKAPSESNTVIEDKASKSVEKDKDSKTVIQTTESSPDEKAPVVMSKKSAQTVKKAAEEVPSIEVEVPVEEKNLSSNGAELLKNARKLYDEKKYQEALDTIQRFFDVSVNKIDEGLYLQGQILEAKSAVQNIKNAIDSYDLVVKNYPGSNFWDSANKRSMYLKRFYINIR